MTPYNRLIKVLYILMLKPKLQFPSIFSSKTPITSERLKGLSLILSFLYSHPDSDQFREPLQYQERGLVNYDVLIKNPMDISTAQKMLKKNIFNSCEECLDFTQTIFENSFLYNKDTQWILDLTKNCQLVFHKLVKNYLPEVTFKKETTDKSLQSSDKKIQKKNKRFQKDTQKIETCITEADSYPESYSQIESHSKKIEAQTHRSQQLSRSQSSTKSSKKEDIKKVLFDLIHQASEKSLEVLYIMAKNQNIQSISTQKDGNCVIDLEKLTRQFIIKATAFLKNQIQRAKTPKNLEKKKKFKNETVLSRYDI